MELVFIDAALQILTYVEMLPEIVVIPPLQQRRIIGSGMPSLPIKLGQVVIDPSFFHPQPYVGVQIIVILKTVGVTSIGVASFVPVDTEGTDTEAYPWFRACKCQFYLLNKQIYVVAPPVTPL
jgi:hypothetical protein